MTKRKFLGLALLVVSIAITGYSKSKLTVNDLDRLTINEAIEDTQSDNVKKDSDSEEPAQEIHVEEQASIKVEITDGKTVDYNGISYKIIDVDG